MAAQAVVAHLTNLAHTPMQQKLGYLLTFAVIIALVAGGWMWGQAPEYRVLFSNLNDKDGGSIIATLEQMNVPYKFSGSSTIMVPVGQVDELRMKLAAQGLPKSAIAGFELMEQQKFGTSQFGEQLNYQRGLEGELARSIQTIAGVQTARVHLALTQPTAFVRDQQKNSASVVLTLHPGRSIDQSQVAAIVHLVSNSVINLDVKNVSVVDQQGQLLSAPTSASPALGLEPKQLKYVHELESSYVKRIEAIISPLTGPSNVHAQVTADLDFTESENVAESYKPNQNPPDATIRSQQSSESSTSNAQAAAGVPGAVSNQPPAPASAPINAPAGAAPNTAGAPGSSSGTAAQTPVNLKKDSTVNYEVDKVITHKRQAVGGIKRLSVAVVVNNRRETDAEGKVTSKPLSDAEKTQITELVKDAIGFNKERGDTVSVANAAFLTEDPTPVADVPIWKKPDTIAFVKDSGKQLLIGVIVLYLVLGVLRPLLKSFAAPPPAPALELARPDGTSEGDTPIQAVLSYEQQLQSAKQLAQQDPKIVATVVKHWVSGNDR